MTRKHLVSAAGIGTVLVLCVLYLFAVALKTPLTEKPVEVGVSLPGSGGLYKGSEVTYRGVRVGRVTELNLTDDGVQATARLDSTARVPVDARPKVRSLSPVGEQYIDFQPDSPSGPFLTAGDTVRGVLFIYGVMAILFVLAIVALMAIAFGVSTIGGAQGLASLMMAPAVFAFGLVAFGFLGMGPVTIAVEGGASTNAPSDRGAGPPLIDKDRNVVADVGGELPRAAIHGGLLHGRRLHRAAPAAAKTRART